jgi:hypothetical protein
MFSSEVAGKHSHLWTIFASRDADALTLPEHEIAMKYLAWVWKANISLHQATHRHPFELLDSLIGYGFYMSTCQPAPSKFPRLSFAKARKQIRQIDAVQLENNLQLFQRGYAHRSLDAGTIHVNSLVGFVLLRTENLSKRCDFLLDRSVDSIEANADFDKMRACSAIRDLKARNIVVRSIVGDGLAA